MENPATWGEAERVVRHVLDEHWKNKKLALTDPDKVMTGLSLERKITDALREAGLLKDQS
jgi:hypothetical protein